MGCPCHDKCGTPKQGTDNSKQKLKQKVKINSTVNTNIKHEEKIKIEINQNSKNTDDNNSQINISYPDLDEKPIYQEPVLKPYKEDYILKVEKFMKENEIQDDFYEKNDEENDDKLYLELKRNEKKELEKIFSNLRINYERDNFQKEKLNLIFDKELVSSFIAQENSKQIIKKKIIKEIEKIESNKEKFEINHLTALVVGKEGIDKKSLIQYMLKLDSLEINNAEKKDFVVFESKKVPYLRLIKYRPIGYGENDSAEVITKETVNYIKEQNKANNYNNFVHCIWYCFKGAKLEDLEIEYLTQLKNAYREVEIPVILINLNNYEKDSKKNWKRQFRKKKIKKY